MKKNTAQKSSLKSWLIALIVFAVVAVIAVGVSFIPNAKNCKEIASAAVTGLVDGEIYLFQNPASYANTVNESEMTIINLTGLVFTTPLVAGGTGHSHVFDTCTYRRSSTGPYLYFSFKYQGSSVMQFRYKQSNNQLQYQSITWYVNAWGIQDISEYQVGFQYSYTGAIPNTNASANLYAVLEHFVAGYPVLDPVSDFNIVGNDSIMDFKVFKVSNAPAYADSNNVVLVDIAYSSTDNPLAIQLYNDVELSLLGSSYYLCLCTPREFDRVEIIFDGFDDAEPTILTSNQLISTNHNYDYLSDIYDDGYNDGAANAYDDGYAAGTANQNNLVDVIWATIQMPVHILFGDIDTNPLSPTYNQYVGGLFNFTILGLDIRAFVLSIMSVCIIIAIMKIVVKFVV